MNGTTASPADLAELLDLAARSFLSYAETSAAPVVVDDEDRSLAALLGELHARESGYVARAYEIVFDAGLRPEPRPYDLKAGNFNYTRTRTIAARFVMEIEGELTALRLLQARLPVGGDGRAALLAADFVALRMEGRRRVEDALSALKPPAPPAATSPRPAPPVSA